SYQIRQLEQNLGTSLFHRRVRQVSLSKEGAALFAVCDRLFRDLSDELASFSAAANNPVLTIAVSTYVATRWLSPRLRGFFEDQGHVTLRLQHSVNAPDFALEDVDVAIRWGKPSNLPRHAQMLLPMPMVPVAAPALITGRVGPGPIKQPADLAGHLLLRDDAAEDLWPEWLGLAGLAAMNDNPSQTVSDPNVRIQAAVDGQGVVLADDLVGDELASGRLIAPFDLGLTGYGYHLLASKSSRSRPAVRAFMAWAQTAEKGGQQKSQR
ncbi:MAG: LysR substrate-binding domain-containing protein, partial [Pseudomonadota bacterium]